MRVLYLNPFSQEVSGPDESLRTLLGVLVPRGVEPHVVLPAPGPQVKRYQALGAHVHIAPLAPLRRELSLSAALYPARLARGAAAVTSLAQRIKPDLIHTNMEVLLEGALAASTLRLPHVLHYRGNTLDRPKVVFDALVGIWTRTADLIYCVSGATATLFNQRGHRDDKVEVLYNPVNLSAFGTGPASPELRATLGAQPGQPLIGIVGRINPRKDLETFVWAAALVAAAFPLARFVVVGGEDSEFESAYRQDVGRLVDELGLTERLVFAGPRRDIASVMRALDLLVLTSRHEGFGRVVAEAMAVGRPVVVSNEGALPELVGAGADGLLAPPGDAAGFARQILRLLRDQELSARLGARAVVAARQFDVEVIGERVWTRYGTLIGGG